MLELHKRIDTHFHIVLPIFSAAIDAAGGDPSGWKVPSWTPLTAIGAMKTLGVTKAVLSTTAPGPSVAGNGEAGRKLARDINVETKRIVDEHPSSFGWFASLPDWTDVDGAIAEAQWALREAKADGVVVMTSYQDKLLGDISFQPIWDKLDELKAVIFVHPTSLNVTPKAIAGNLPQPVVDYPLATTRTAIDLVLTKTLSNHTKVKIILSHAGGTLPFLAERVLGLLAMTGMSDAEIRRDLQRFWFDVALSTSKAQLQGLLAFTSPEKILFGSDWPYIPLLGAKVMTEHLDAFVSNDTQGQSLAHVDCKNAEILFGWEDIGKPIESKY